MQAALAVIFDLDGTLLDTIDDLTDAMNAALAKRGYPLRSVDECKYLVGKGVDVFARDALPHYARTPETVQALITDYRAEYAARWTRKTCPYAGIRETLTALNERGVPCAVLSNKHDTTVKQSVTQFLPSVSFAEVRGTRPSVPLKPDPTPALDIARNLAVEPANIMFVGDTKTDMQTAVSAGMLPAGALWGFRTEDELREHGARFLIRHPADLLPHLNPRSSFEQFVHTE